MGDIEVTIRVFLSPPVKSCNNAGRLAQLKATIRRPTVPHGNFILRGDSVRACKLMIGFGMEDTRGKHPLKI